LNEDVKEKVREKPDAYTIILSRQIEKKEVNKDRYMTTKEDAKKVVMAEKNDTC